MSLGPSRPPRALIGAGGGIVGPAPLGLAIQSFDLMEITCRSKGNLRNSIFVDRRRSLSALICGTPHDVGGAARRAMSDIRFLHDSSFSETEDMTNARRGFTLIELLV